ncbi:hypothetical protein FMN50_02725 [Rhodobacterales bacterium]|nr:hypothetical protein FMN50_02725 [Rhodobacterales bacterium]
MRGIGSVPFLLAAIGILAALIWIYRSGKRASPSPVRHTSQRTQSGAVVPSQWGYRVRKNSHPVEGVEDPRLSCAALLVLVADLDGGISKAEKDCIFKQLRTTLGLPPAKAPDVYETAIWLCNQEADRDEMVRRLIRHTVSLGGYETLPDMIQMVSEVGKADTGTLTDDTALVVEKLKLLNA